MKAALALHKQATGRRTSIVKQLVADAAAVDLCTRCTTTMGICLRKIWRISPTIGYLIRAAAAEETLAVSAGLHQTNSLTIRIYSRRLGMAEMISLAASETRKSGTTDTDPLLISAPQAAFDTILIITHRRPRAAATVAANVMLGIHTHERTAPAQISVHVQGQEKAAAVVVAAVDHLTATIMTAVGQGMDTGTADIDRRETMAGTVNVANQKSTQVGGI